MNDLDDLALGVRARLPDDLETWLPRYPRGDWEAHQRFEGLAKFWIDRHGMFRQLTALITAETEALIAGDREPASFAPRLMRYGSLLIQELHGHHHVEDAHYFPAMARLAPPLARGFRLLHADHEALDPLLADLTDATNAILGQAAEGPKEKTSEMAMAYMDRANDFSHLMERHLTDEEDLIIPVLLDRGHKLSL